MIDENFVALACRAQRKAQGCGCLALAIPRIYLNKSLFEHCIIIPLI